MSPQMPSASLPIRGVHIDCRAQMLQFARLKQVYQDLARWGFNTILFEYENRFPFRGRLRRAVAPDALTKKQILELNRMAADLGLQVMPLVQCLGHLEYVLRLPGFHRLAEPRGDPFRAHARAMYAVCPSRRQPLALFQEMASQVLDLHGEALLFHMGGDEVELAPTCPRCGPRLKKIGLSRVLVEHYAGCAEWLRRQGPDPVIWGDLLLAHPEQLDALRGKAIIMDWDYSSALRPLRHGPLWGLRHARQANPLEPKTWPKVQRELFADYILDSQKKRVRPFPYVSFLRDHGFQVIVASAARASGDNFCVPASGHIDNVMGAAQTASTQHVLGSVITSWALRRAPWPLTENTLIAGGMTMTDPKTSRRAVDVAFAKEHFGVASPALAKIPLLLGETGWGMQYVRALPGIDAKSGRWPGRDYAARVAAAEQDPKAFRRSLRRLGVRVAQARALLKRARPRNKHQRERTRLWCWACDVLAHFAEFGPQILKTAGDHDAAALRAARRRAQRLAKQTEDLLGRINTRHTMLDEMQCRFGVHLDYIDRMIAAATP